MSLLFTDPTFVATLVSIAGVLLATFLGFRYKNKVRATDLGSTNLAAQLRGWQTLAEQLQERLSALEKQDIQRLKRINELEISCDAYEEENRKLKVRVSTLERRLGLDPNAT